jgi:RimJ/RimL family protein N-acetyltransferase
VTAADPSLRVTLRSARDEDAERLLQWRNDPNAVRFSASGRAVTAEEHAAWLAARRRDRAIRLWIAERGGEAVGQVRVDVSERVGTVSIAVAAEHRGQGVGVAMLAAMIDAVGHDDAIDCMQALVHPDNEVSLRLFERAGFRRLQVMRAGFVVFEVP